MNKDFYDYKKVSELVVEYCREHGINQSDYAILIEVKPESLSRIKAGKGCSIETLAKIAVLAGTSLKDLLRDAPLSVRTDVIAAGPTTSALV